jgi:hypothetical protein
MKRLCSYIAATLLSLSALSAATAETTVKVALTDMSSAMGMGPAGHGMMGVG